MHDALYRGRVIRTLNVIDEADRCGLGIDLAVSIPGTRVIRFMDHLIEIHGRPAAIRCDNGPELTSQVFVDCSWQRKIDIRYIQPGKPEQNTFKERFNRSYRQEVLSAHLFESIADDQVITDSWLKRCNEVTQHDPLGSISPARYREKLLEAEFLL